MSQRAKTPSFNRSANQRGALLRSLMRSLVIHERISTTEAKAKAIRPLIEKMITRARVDTVANRRLIASRLGDPKATKKLFEAIAPRYKGRSGGYTRIVKRVVKADGRKNAYIAFVN